MALPAKRARTLIDFERIPDVPKALIDFINRRIEIDCRLGNADTKLEFKRNGNDVNVIIDSQHHPVLNVSASQLMFAIYIIYSREYEVIAFNDILTIQLPQSDATMFYSLSMPWVNHEVPTTHILMFLAIEYKIDVDDILRAMGTPKVARGIYIARELQIRRDVTKQKLAPSLQRLCRDLVCVVKSFL